jgi:Predicted membrane protein (DUF2178).
MDANKKYPRVEMTDEMMVHIMGSASLLTLQIVMVACSIIGAILVFLEDRGLGPDLRAGHCSESLWYP